MSPELYWEGDCRMATHYREAQKIKNQQKNQELWMQGLYFCHAINATVGNMFSDKNSQKNEYLSEPLPLTIGDIERKAKQQQEKLRSKLAAWSANINAKMSSEARRKEE
jgi:hypothetical protein